MNDRSPQQPTAAPPIETVRELSPSILKIGTGTRVLDLSLEEAHTVWRELSAYFAAPGELSPGAQAGAPLPSPDPEEKFAPAAAASVVAPETKAISVDAHPHTPSERRKRQRRDVSLP